MSKVLQINLLGSFHLQWGDVSYREAFSPRLQSLFAYLLLNRQTTLSRRQIAFQFWPDSSEAQAFANLRTRIAHLRRFLPEADRFLYLDGHWVQWNSGAPYQLDVDRFENAALAGNLEQASSYYSADLLPDCYDDWISPERERLRQLYCRVMERLIQEREEERDYEGAIQYARTYLAYDPLRENTYSGLIRLHALQGNRSEAVRVFRQCTEVLARELGVEPGPGVRKLHEQLLWMNEERQTENTRTKEASLIGRKREWQLLLQAWQTAAKGSPGMILMMGESGIGKTRLLEEFQKWAQRQGITTIYTRCYASQGRLAYAPVIEWLRSPAIQNVIGSLDSVWLGEIARLLPEISLKFPNLARGSPYRENWQRMYLFEAMTRATLSAAQPLLLIMDDLQWADQDTLAWLSHLMRFDPHSSLLIIGAARPEKPGVELTLKELRIELQREQRLIEFELEPLSRSDTQKLVASLGNPNCSSEEAEQIFLETEGNPLFVVERLSSDRDRSRDRKSSSPEKMLNQGYMRSGKVEAVIASRLSELSGSAQALAALAAVCGRKFHIDVLLNAWKSSEEKLVEGLEELLLRRIVREQGTDEFDFSHDKIREAVYLRLSMPHRRLLHRSLAQSYEAVHSRDTDAVSGEIALHYQRAGLNEFALPYFLRAGELASHLYANQEAIRHLKCALDIIATLTGNQSSDSMETTFRVLDTLGDVLERTGQHQEARDIFQLVFDYCPDLDTVRTVQTYRKIGQTWLPHQAYSDVLQNYEKAEQILEELRGNGRPSLPGEITEWHNLKLGRMWVYYYQGETEKIQEISTQILPSIQTQGSPQQRCDLYNCLAGMILRRDRYVASPEAIRYHFLSLEAANEAGDEGQVTFSYFNLGFSHLWGGLLEDAGQFFLKSKAKAEQIGDENLQILCWTYLSILYRKMGLVDPAREAIHNSLEITDRGQRTMYYGVAKANRAWLDWREGDYEQARATGESALEILDSCPVTYAFYWTALWPVIGSALGQGDLGAAVEHARGLLSPKQQPPPPQIAHVLEECLAASSEQHREAARIHMQEALLLAKEMGYL